MNKLDILINNFGIKHINYRTFEKGNLSISFYTNDTGGPFYENKTASVNDIQNWIRGAEITYTIDSNLHFSYYDEDETFNSQNIERRLSEIASYLLKQFLNVDYYKKIEENIKTYSKLKKKQFYSLNFILEKEINPDLFKIHELSWGFEEYISAKTNQGADGKYRIYSDNLFFIEYDGVLVQDMYLKQFLPESVEEVDEIGPFSPDNNLSIVFRKDLTETFLGNYSKSEHLAIFQPNLNVDNGILNKYNEYVELYAKHEEEWNKKVETDGGGLDWGDINAPFLTFEEFKRKFPGGVASIMTSNGGIINRI